MKGTIAESTGAHGSFLFTETGPADVFTREDLSAAQQMFGRIAEDFMRTELLPKAERIDQSKDVHTKGGPTSTRLRSDLFAPIASYWKAGSKKKRSPGIALLNRRFAIRNGTH